jgi:pimeloyl-ACP methyl ester carboxylesterase
LRGGAGRDIALTQQPRVSMKRQAYNTEGGPIWVWGEPDAFKGAKPIVFVILGAFAVERGAMFNLQAYLPEADVFIAHLPGNFTPSPRDHSIATYASSFSQVLTYLARPAVVIGVSIGALVAFSLTSPNVAAMVALDPPLTMGKAWPLLANFRERLSNHPDDQALAEFLWNIFGISPDEHVERNYIHLLDNIKVPTWVIYGEEPLYPERAVTTLPSLVDEPERVLLRSHPHVTTGLMRNTGHNIPRVGYEDIINVTRGLLSKLPAGGEGVGSSDGTSETG